MSQHRTNLLLRKFSQVRRALEQQAARLRLPSFVRYDTHGILPEYQEADDQAQEMGINLKAYGTSSGFDPDAEIGSEMEPSPVPIVEFSEWPEPGWPGTSEDRGIE